MTGNQIITRAKKRVKDTTSIPDWSGFFADAIDEIFSAKEWRFSRKEINYIHSGSTFEYQLNNTADELALNKLISAYCATSFSLIGGIPIPSSGTGIPLEYYPYSAFIRDFPNHVYDGTPRYITEITRNDGTNGALIGIYERPTQDAAVWLYGDFIPSYVIDDNPLPILPRQFHRIIVHKIVEYVAVEKGLDGLARDAERKFNIGMEQLDNWDSSQPIYRPRFQPYRSPYVIRGVRYPGNFPVEVTR